MYITSINRTSLSGISRALRILIYLRQRMITNSIENNSIVYLCEDLVVYGDTTESRDEKYVISIMKSTSRAVHHKRVPQHIPAGIFLAWTFVQFEEHLFS